MNRSLAVVLVTVAALTGGQRTFAAVIDVFPTAGAPFQDAINGAATGITLDATFDNNLIKKNVNLNGAVDLGGGNCWQANSGTGSFPSTCP